MARKKTTLPAENAGQKQQTGLVELTPREKRAAMVPTFKGNTLKISPEQRDAMLDAIHTDHGEVMRSTLATSISGHLHLDGAEGEAAMNVALRLLVELQPQNALERMLLAQFIACDKAASQCLNIGFNPTNDANAKCKYLGLGVQFQGLLVRQVEALQKLRTGGQQRVVVEHVHVEAGAQAVIGNVTQGPGGGGGNGR